MMRHLVGVPRCAACSAVEVPPQLRFRDGLGGASVQEVPVYNQAFFRAVKGAR